MRYGARIQVSSLSLFGVLTIAASIVPGVAQAAEIIIFRDVPVHNALEPLPPGYGNTVAVPTEERDLILSLVPGPKMLGDGDFGAVLASPPPSGGGSGLQTSILGHPIDPAGGGQPLSNLPGGGMGSFSSLSSLGGQISGQVGGTVNNALQGLSNGLGLPGSQ